MNAEHERETRIFVWPVRVYYEDTDSGGVVYYANYLKFMERARSEWLRHCGIEQDELIRQYDVIFAVRAVQADYRRPARFNDLLAVTAELSELGRASISFTQHVLRLGAASSNLTGFIAPAIYQRMLADSNSRLCVGRIKIACLKASTLRPCPIPTHLIAEITRVG